MGRQLGGEEKPCRCGGKFIKGRGGGQSARKRTVVREWPIQPVEEGTEVKKPAKGYGKRGGVKKKLDGKGPDENGCWTGEFQDKSGGQSRRSPICCAERKPFGFEGRGCCTDEKDDSSHGTPENAENYTVKPATKGDHATGEECAGG